MNAAPLVLPLEFPVPLGPLSDEDIYKAHVNNLRHVAQALDSVERQVCDSLKSGQDQQARTFLSLYIMLLGVWAENRLSKLLYEESGFSRSDRQTIRAQRQKLEQWKAVLKTGFRKKYNITSKELNISNLGAENFERYSRINSMINTEMKPVIEIRNKLAHGQWLCPLNSNGSAISGDYLGILLGTNYLHAKFTRNMIGHFCDAVHDLVASNVAFERDFPKHFSLLEDARQQSMNKDYSKWLDIEKRKYERGKAKRKENIKKIKNEESGVFKMGVNE